MTACVPYTCKMKGNFVLSILNNQTTVQSLYNTLWLPNFFTMEFYKGIIGSFSYNSFVKLKLSLHNSSLITWSILMDSPQHSIEALPWVWGNRGERAFISWEYGNKGQILRGTGEQTNIGEQIFDF